MIKVKLDLYELMASSQTGLLRVFESIRLKQSWGYGFKGDLNEQISKSISGSCAELACSKYLETDYTHHVNHGSSPDLLYHDLHLQVRSQRPKENNFLITHDSYCFRVFSALCQGDHTHSEMKYYSSHKFFINLSAQAFSIISNSI